MRGGCSEELWTFGFGKQTTNENKMPASVGLVLPLFNVIRLCAHLAFVFVGGHL